MNVEAIGPASLWLALAFVTFIAGCIWLEWRSWK